MNIIEEARLNKYMSQAELARRTNFSKGYISKLENNKKTPSPDAINILSSALEICPIALYIFFYLNNECECKYFKDKNTFCSECEYCNKELKNQS